MQHIFLALKHYLETKRSLTVVPDPRDPINADKFTITDSAGKRITVSWVHPEYVRVSADYGTPTEVFSTHEHPAGPATLSPLHSPERQMHVDELADHICDVLMKLIELPTTA